MLKELGKGIIKYVNEHKLFGVFVVVLLCGGGTFVYGMDKRIDAIENSNKEVIIASKDAYAECLESRVKIARIEGNVDFIVQWVKSQK